MRVTVNVYTGNTYRKGRISTTDLLVLTSSDQLILVLNIPFSFFTTQAVLMRRQTVLSCPLQ